MKKYVLMLLALFLIGCTEVIKESSDSDTTEDAPIVHTIAGKLQKGRCLKDARVQSWPLINGTMSQSGAQFIEFTGDDGSYSMDVQGDSEYVFTYFKGYCDDEVNGGSGWQELYGIRKVSDPISNTNPLTKVSYHVAKDLFADGFGTVEACLAESERLTTEFMSMPKISERFGSMNLEKDGEQHRELSLASAAILYGRTDVEAGDFMIEIATAIMNGDTALKDEIRAVYDELPLMTVKSNLEASYASVGVDIDVPKLWRIHAPDYYADLLERTPAVQTTYNLDDTTSCSFDQSDFNTFAVPYTFQAGIESTRYIALNVAKDIDVSIWTVATHVGGYPAPGIKILDLTRLRENLLAVPGLSYNGMLGDNHGLKTGDEVYIVFRKDADFVLSKSCGGDRLYTAYTLASDNEGLTWIGDGNNADRFFYFTGLILKGFN